MMGPTGSRLVHCGSTHQTDTQRPQDADSAYCSLFMATKREAAFAET
jgi:hypothetical protein